MQRASQYIEALIPMLRSQMKKAEMPPKKKGPGPAVSSLSPSPAQLLIPKAPKLSIGPQSLLQHSCAHQEAFISNQLAKLIIQRLQRLAVPLQMLYFHVLYITSTRACVHIDTRTRTPNFTHANTVLHAPSAAASSCQGRSWRAVCGGAFCWVAGGIAARPAGHV